MTRASTVLAAAAAAAAAALMACGGSGKSVEDSTAPKPGAWLAPGAQGRPSSGGPDLETLPGSAATGPQHIRRLGFEVTAEPVRFGRAWGVRVGVKAMNRGHATYHIDGAPAPAFSGVMTIPGEVDEDNYDTEFNERCGVAPSQARRVLEPGADIRFERDFGSDADDAVERGGQVRLRVRLCRVGMPGGGWTEWVDVATVVLSVPRRGGARVEVFEPERR